MANLAAEKQVEEKPLAEQTVRMKYIGDLRTGPQFVYGKKLVQNQEYDFPFYIAELCYKEPTLFEVVDDTPIGKKLINMAKPKGETREMR